MKSEDIYNLIWTAMWLIFIAILCLIFKSLGPLWMLLVWLLGIYGGKNG